MRRLTAGPLLILGLAAAAMWPAGLASAGGGCHQGATEGTGDTVEMTKACFGPSVLRVDPGTEVTFVNKDPLAHNISAEWGTGLDLDEGDTFKATFADEGTFPYACTYHYGMTGAVVVGDGTGPGTGARIEGGRVVETTPLASEQVESVTSSTQEGSRVLGWAVAGGIGLLVGTAFGGRLLRRRRES